MSEGHVYKLIDVVGSSTQSYDDAVRCAVNEAKKTIKGLKWFEVTEFRGAVEGEQIVFQATVRMGFRLESR